MDDLVWVVRDQVAETRKLQTRRSQLQLNLLAPQKVAVNGIPDVGSRSTVEVLGGMNYSLPSI